ncbi:hypothetical protein WOLCODRAFT_80993 [Wolfiporia cocos MD-104 SS10]|uniref:Uncharacterized protein n=1 Tax=Wolfiporia cocos (strain MD-104) TaxID=742152 RepID=A0A2H3JGK4_WOLCO|nr:hypothetical protein WOLCODRAFT_80993 [Wolfiporia cocos MD-104 SS10]
MKPSLDQLNHFLRPLVDELALFWEPGVFFSRTADFVNGRLVHCALIPLVCDLPAAWQVSGHGGHSATHLCSFCWQKLEDIENLDSQQWRKHSPQEHQRLAEQWKSKTSVKAHQETFDKNGVRWSELLCLPYWDPILFTVIDTMHNQYLGLLKTHCRDVWGMKKDMNDRDGIYNSKHKIHVNLARTELPSWINPAPANLGTSERGKLHANQWLTACTINFPITLIRLWGVESATSRKHGMLHNFMELVATVTVSSLLETSDDLIVLYNASITRYLKSLKGLYKEVDFKPNHHLALHVGDFLREFGPVHSVRTFFLEQLNYTLQREHTNLKFGKYVAQQSLKFES